MSASLLKTYRVTYPTYGGVNVSRLVDAPGYHSAVDRALVYPDCSTVQPTDVVVEMAKPHEQGGGDKPSADEPGYSDAMYNSAINAVEFLLCAVITIAIVVALYFIFR